MQYCDEVVGHQLSLGQYFRRFLPVVVDVETGGLNPHKHALLEVAVVFLKVGSAGLIPGLSQHYHIRPFEKSEITESSAQFLGISASTKEYGSDHHQFEQDVFEELHDLISSRVEREGCTRAILVGHNAAFDLSFMQAAFKRNRIKDPFHQFSTLDTVSMSAAILGHTVLSKACMAAGICWDNSKAHCAMYDCQQTAQLFCRTINQIRSGSYAMVD